MVEKVNKRHIAAEFGRVFNSKLMVITLLDEILTLRGERKEQVWTGFNSAFTLLRQLMKGNCVCQPISQFCNLQESSLKGI